MKKQSVDFEEIKDYLQTGDLILMHGLHSSSHVIETIEGSLWSHVTMVVLASDIGIDADNENILLWESDEMNPVKDVILKRGKSGPMLVKLSERLKYNLSQKEDSIFAVRHLYAERNQKMYDIINNIIPIMHKSTFPDTFHEFLNPIEGRVFKKKTSLDTIFCSELIAYTYIKMGLLTSIHPVNSYAPVDFSEKLSVGLLKRAWLGDEIKLNIDLNKLK